MCNDKLKGRKVKMISQDPCTEVYKTGDILEICVYVGVACEGHDVGVESATDFGCPAQVVNTKYLRYLNNKEVKV